VSTYILDTGILLGYFKGAGYASYVEREYAISSPPNITVISIVTLGEIWSIALQRGWGEEKQQKLREMLNTIPNVDISRTPIIERYAQIDSYSQGKNSILPLPRHMSSRNMGKNDIWIAATGSVINAILLTNDNDFEHLNGVFLTVKYIDQNLK